MVIRSVAVAHNWKSSANDGPLFGLGEAAPYSARFADSNASFTDIYTTLWPIASVGSTKVDYCIAR